MKTLSRAELNEAKARLKEIQHVKVGINADIALAQIDPELNQEKVDALKARMAALTAQVDDLLVFVGVESVRDVEGGLRAIGAVLEGSRRTNRRV